MNRHQLRSPTTTYNIYPPISTSTKDKKKVHSSISSNRSNQNSVVKMGKCTCKFQAKDETDKPTSEIENHMSDSEVSDVKSMNPTDQFFQSLKPSRIPYSLSEDEEILKFVLKDDNIFKTSSISLWKLLEQKKGNLPRTYQSLKNRFYRNIKPLILKKFRKFLTDELINNLLIKFPELKKDLHYVSSLQNSTKRVESTSQKFVNRTNSCPKHGKESSGIMLSTVDGSSTEMGIENKIAEKHVNKSHEDDNCWIDSKEKLFFTKNSENANVSDLKKQISKSDLDSVTKIVSSSPKNLTSNAVNKEISKTSSSAIEVAKSAENPSTDSSDVIKNSESAVMNIFHEERTAYRFVLPVNLQNLQHSNQLATNKTTKTPNIDLNIVLVNSDDKSQNSDGCENLLLKPDLPLNININVTLNGFKYSNGNQVKVNDENEILQNTEDNCVDQNQTQELDTKLKKRTLNGKRHRFKKGRLIANIDSIESNIFTFKKLESLSAVNKARLSALLAKLKEVNQRSETSTLSDNNSESVEKCSPNSTKTMSPEKLENLADDARKTVIIKTLSQKYDDEESSSLESTNCSTEDDSSYNEILEDLQRTHKVGSQTKNSESEKDCTSQLKQFNSPRKRNLRSDPDIQQKEWKKKKLEINNSFNLKLDTTLENAATSSTPKAEKTLQKASKSLVHTSVPDDKNQKSPKLLNNAVKSTNRDMMDNISLRETRSSTRRKILEKA